jgi:carbon monoxide dehydrogenase subunit G
MKLENEFRVDVPVEEAWRVLLDVERIAPCMPGAQLQEVEGDEYRGIVKVKVGPITAQYKGVARIAESDDTSHRAVIRAEGRDTRGQGNASATATAVLLPDGDGTRVSIDSDVTITGKVAQFGRGVIADVSAKLLDQFVACLERDVLSASGDAPASNEVAESGARTIDAPEAEPVDLLRTAGAPVLKRAVPVAAAVVVVVVVVLILLLR